MKVLLKMMSSEA